MAALWRRQRSASEATVGARGRALRGAAVPLALLALLGALSGAATFTGLHARPSPAKTPRSGLQFNEDVKNIVAPKRGGRRQTEEEEEEAEERRRQAEERAEKIRQMEELEEQESGVVTPVLYPIAKRFPRLSRQDLGRSLAMRRWIKKGKDQGFTTVPFSAALRHVVPNPDVDVALVSRREKTDRMSKAWQAKLEELPLFDIAGLAATPEDLDPLEPAWEAPLDELPTDEELKQDLQDERVLQAMQRRFLRSEEDLARLAEDGSGARVLREILAELPASMVTEENRELIRETVKQVLAVMWAVHATTNSTQLRWRLACTDDKLEAPTPDTSLRAILLLAGEMLEFIPQQLVDREKVSAEQLLSAEQIRRMDSQAWAASLAKSGVNASQACKQVPPGWLSVLKGESWPGMKDRGAVYRLPQSGKRLYIEVELVGKPRKADLGSKSSGATADESEQEYRPSFLESFGPAAGLAAFVFGLAQQTFFFKAGRSRRMELDKTLRALQRRPEESAEVEAARLQGLEQTLFTDMEVDEYPVVLVVGAETETGQVVLRKLVTSGYPCVVLKSGDNEESLGSELSEGTSYLTVTAQTRGFLGTRSNPGPRESLGTVPDSLYDAVAGVDKLVICDCDEPNEEFGEVVSNVLRSWQLYRKDFAEEQRAFNSKVQVFNFQRQTDFELWDLERQYPSDMCYGVQRAGWTRNSYGDALFVGQFFEDMGQCQLRSPRLKLNFSKFGGLIVTVYNQAVNNKFSWFLRTSDFEQTRVQFEFDFVCEASSWCKFRMPFNAFKPVRADGVPIDDPEEFQLRREDVVQMGVSFRTEGVPVQYRGDRMNYFSLQIEGIRAFRLQKEPQVVYAGRLDDVAPTVQEADADQAFVDPEDRPREGPYNGLWTRPKTGAEAVIGSGLAFSLLRVNGFNDHPGGKFPVVLNQAPLHRPHLSFHSETVRSISRGDVAALLVSAMSEPNCVNTEIIAGEASEGAEESSAPQVEITSTLQEDVRGYLKQLTLNGDVCFSILRQYKMFNVDIIVNEDATIDDFIDVLEETGTAPRQYCKCLYVYNKIDMLNISQVEELARQPYSVVISVSKGLNLDGLLERIWQELDLRRIYTKKKGLFPDFTEPIVLTCQRGNKTMSVENAVGLLHKSLLDEFKSALVWGSSVRASPQVCGLKHELQDEDVMQITKLTAAEKQKKMHGKKTGTTLAGGNTQVDPSGKKDSSLSFHAELSEKPASRAVAAMRLFVRGIAGETSAVEVASAASVADVQLQIQEVQGVPCSEQRLIFGGRSLQSEELLAACGVEEESVVRLCFSFFEASSSLLLLYKVVMARQSVRKSRCAAGVAAAALSMCYLAAAFVMPPAEGQGAGRREALLGLAGAAATLSAEPAQAKAGAGEWMGYYSDPQHPMCPRKIVYEYDLYDKAQMMVDGGDGNPGCEKKVLTRWTAKVDWKAGSDEITIDFSKKGGPAGVVGKWEGDGIVFPDGNKWKKIIDYNTGNGQGGLKKRRWLLLHVPVQMLTAFLHLATQESTLFVNLDLEGGGKKRKKKTYTKPKWPGLVNEQADSAVKAVSVSVNANRKIKHKRKFYKVDSNDKVTRLRRECPHETCGPGGLDLARFLAADNMAPYNASEEVEPPFMKKYFSNEFMMKYEPLAAAKRRLDEDKNDAEAQKMYDTYFPMYKNYDWCSSWDGTKYDLVFYGVSGYTGYLMMEYLKRVSLKQSAEDFTFAFAGRTPGKVQDLRDREFAGTPYEDTPVFQMSYDDPYSMIDLVKSARCIINVAGPYMLTQGELMIDACISMGVHYCDISGEIPWSRRITPLHKHAQKNGAYIIPSAASAGGFPDLCTFLCAKKAREDYNEELRKAICYVNGGGAIATASGGTLKTRATMAAGGDETRKMMGDPYALGGFVPDRDRHGIKYCNIEFGTGSVTTKVRAEDLDANMSKISEDKHLGIWRGPNVYSYFDTRIVRRSNMLLADMGGQPYGKSLNFLQFSVLPAEMLLQGKQGGGGGGGGAGGSVEAEKKALEAKGVYYGAGEGPPLEELDDAWSAWFVWAQTEKGHEVRCDFIGRDGYFETARIAVETAMCLVFDREALPFRGGVLTPAVACGEALAQRLINSGVKFSMGKWHDVSEFNPPPNP
ncbi:DRG2 [Symbiodinium sp. CCMP2456]|nr:DRG2 [Symbiodinium sp. CCMP2456]